MKRYMVTNVPMNMDRPTELEPPKLRDKPSDVGLDWKLEAMDKLAVPVGPGNMVVLLVCRWSAEQTSGLDS